MKWIVKENTWLPGMSHGWGNGYVIIPKGHPMHGKHYDDIDVSVHGGLTFAEAASGIDWPEIQESDKSGWIVGFDTGHYMDTITRWPKELVEQETKELEAQLSAISSNP